ncbi:molybdopterin-dependent oxidoreductase [Brevundimonas sp.]|uniref:molybdopterin-dependent oxidoreductase n=1 Tax=Brevundimonas sp. TaxID=1871086 RepID=UPI002D6004E4|nr:molybdopterin-dependent oxidoreductase [Brevundimonas sp.]HYC98687.1 molybdopterin-dependent oxidoreductase [Brevundimonas sp.]
MTGPVSTTCPYCGVGCGVRATVTAGRSVEIAGDRGHPANSGRLCSKGTHLGETVGLDGRLLYPMIGDRPVGWDEALDLVASRFSAAIAEHGPDSVAFYVSGQLLTEDYYVANKLMKGFIGSGNIDTNSRLCMSSAVSAHLRAFGEDVVPACYDDLDQADLIVLVGSNTAWCHPIVWQRIEAARAARGTRLVVIDPRRTETADLADLHLALRPGSDVALFNGLLAGLRARGALDPSYLAAHVAVPDGFWDALESEGDLDGTAATCDLPRADLETFFDLVAGHPRTVTLFSQGVNQSTQGTDKANAIINVHLATGRIGKPGAAPFSITGQPNAMGGREVGGLASTLAAHMDFAADNVDRVRRFWSAPNMATAAGLKAVDLFRAVGDGRIKALWLMATNPAVSMPEAGAVRAALAACPFVVVSDVMADTDTGRFAHVRLPAAAWGEKDGTVTNSERVISRQRPFFPPPGEARADWRALAEVARRMGHGDAFAWTTPGEVFDEHCRLTAFENQGGRRLDLSPLIGLDETAYVALEPTRWGRDREFADGRFSTPDGRARMVAVTQGPLAANAMTLNTGRYRDQWHTMSRTGLSPRLSQHRREPLVEVHPDDATLAGLVEGDLAAVTTAQGQSVFRVSITDAQRRGEAFVPIHWTDRTGSGGRAGLLPGGAVDPVSGQPGFKLTAMTLSRLETEWRGFLIMRGTPAVEPGCVWWAAVAVPGGRLVELAGDGDPAVLEALLPSGDRMTAVDPARGSLRTAVLTEGRLAGALFVARDGSLPGRDWLIAQLSEPVAPVGLLAGRAPGATVDRGAIVCACFDVGACTILAAIANQRLTTVAEVGAALSAGTNCGSCRPAIAKLIAA